MLSLISPAKSLDFETSAPLNKFSQARYLNEAAELVDQLQHLAPQQISQLMKISDTLGALNTARFQNWRPSAHLYIDLTNKVKQAIFAFTGEVYQGLKASELDEQALNFAQNHLAILSGLYGLLRPLDLIQPYRLEMGTRLTTGRGQDLYAFWKPLIAPAIKHYLTQQPHPILINLASQEYFKSVDLKAINAQVITPVFKDWKQGEYKIISTYAKKARGMMCHYQLMQQIDQPDGLKDFNEAGYRYNLAMSEKNTWVFTRRSQN